MLKCGNMRIIKKGGLMLPALIEIHQVLRQSGYSEMEAADLVTRLLQEEAECFIENHKRYEEKCCFPCLPGLGRFWKNLHACQGIPEALPEKRSRCE